MNFGVKVCDLCDTCIFAGEYEIRDNQIICILCISEEEEQQQENEVSRRSVGDIRPMEASPYFK